MSKYTTRPAALTAAQSQSMLNGGRGVREVVVNGQVVGHYARNKHGVTIGHFDPEALTAEQNPFVAARHEYCVYPAGRTLNDLNPLGPRQKRSHDQNRAGPVHSKIRERIGMVAL